MHADGMNKSMPLTSGVDVVIAKSDSIKKLREHLTALLAPADNGQNDSGDLKPGASKTRSEHS
jgi:hypothetical protein